ncbi:WYL domain-containing protein [Kaistella flava (ex Peng et al. 2021)]|uniref:WYL domain-containing protein n=1 Tax=Kaistella flava (ex Peng et al. 2021) TaxID=2038776 RepID=A0A7M2Y7X1_9FLAO|nr:WYL domain-containing protein [Kaistella flava (ex Peng et al. 2021)]QOW09764.1 WYL domain-containing protein [Kaistella flava (ex Peng et al. 2021)]
MAKIEQILRLKFIEDFLRSRKNKGASYDDIFDYLCQKFEDKDIEADKLKFTKRTFLRDKEAISKVLGTDIIYRRSTDTYAIESDELDEIQEDVFDNLLLVEAFREVKGRKNVMFFEQRKSRGLHLLNGLVHAITHHKIITLQYTKFWEGVAYKKTLEPYALKEFRNRWYLLANEKDDRDFFIKTFALDRISDFDFAPSSFKPKKYDTEKAFENSFGIISTLNEEAQEIVLSFDSDQGSYIKTLPLHHSQEILIDNETEFRIKLTLFPTYDFEREVLSHGKRVKIISPESFKIHLKKEVSEMLKNY